MTLPPSSDPVEIVVPLHEEDISVEKRKVEEDVRVRVHTVHHDHLIDEALRANGSKSNALQSVGRLMLFRLSERKVTRR